MKTRTITQVIVSALAIIGIACFLGTAVGCASLTQPRQPDLFDIAIEKALSDLFATQPQSNQP